VCICSIIVSIIVIHTHINQSHLQYVRDEVRGPALDGVGGPERCPNKIDI
jgi:hypothetical protein